MEVLSDANTRRLLQPDAVIHVQRQDILRQAVSLAFSRRTGSWISFDGSRAVEPGPYDADAVGSALDLIVDEQLAWEAWFDSAGITPLRLCFDHIVANPERMAISALDFIDEGRSPMSGGDLRVALPERQDDEMKQEWLACARANFGFPRNPSPTADCCV
jgi:LPS sulfotransferase NodH